MANGKRRFQSYKKPLRVLLKEIDQAAEAYARNGYREVVGENFLKTPTSLDDLLRELERHHSISPLVSLHGKKVLRKIHYETDSKCRSTWLEDRVKCAFQISGHSIKRGALGRDIVRIAESMVEPFEGLAARIASLRATKREMRKK